MSQVLDAALSEFNPTDLTPRLCGAMLGVMGIPVPPFRTLAEAASVLGHPDAAVQKADPLADGPEVRNAILVASAIDQGDKGLTLSSGLSTVGSLFFGKKAGLQVDDQQKADAALKALAIALLAHRLLDGTPQRQGELLVHMGTGNALLHYYAAVEFALPFADTLAGAEPGAVLEKILADNLGAAASRLLPLGGNDGIAGARALLLLLTPKLKQFAAEGVQNVGPIANAVQKYVPSMFGLARDNLNELVATGADSMPVYRFLVGRFIAEAVLARGRVQAEPGWSPLPAPVAPAAVPDAAAAPAAAGADPVATPFTAPAGAPAAGPAAAAPSAAPDNPFATPYTAPAAPAAQPPQNPFAPPTAAPPGPPPSTPPGPPPGRSPFAQPPGPPPRSAPPGPPPSAAPPPNPFAQPAPSPFAQPPGPPPRSAPPGPPPRSAPAAATPSPAENPFAVPFAAAVGAGVVGAGVVGAGIAAAASSAGDEPELDPRVTVDGAPVASDDPRTPYAHMTPDSGAFRHGRVPPGPAPGAPGAGRPARERHATIDGGGFAAGDPAGPDLAAIEAEIAKMRAEVDAIDPDTDMGAMEARLAALRQRLEGLGADVAEPAAPVVPPRAAPAAAPPGRPVAPAATSPAATSPAATRAPPPPPRRAGPPPPPRRGAAAIEQPKDVGEPLSGAFVLRQGLRDTWLVFEPDGRFASRPLATEFDAARNSGVPGGRYRRADGKLLAVWDDGRKLEGGVAVDDYSVTIDGERYDRADFDLSGASLDGSWHDADGHGLWFSPDGRFAATDRPDEGGRYTLGPHCIELAWRDGRVETRTFLSDLQPAPESPDALWIAGTRYDRG